MDNYNYRLRCASIILTAAGYGWAGGHYIPAISPLSAYIFQVVVISFLIVFGSKYFNLNENEKLKSNWSIKGLSIFSALSLLANIFNVIHGAFGNNDSSYGSHNTFADLVPIVLIILGTSLWLVTLLSKYKSAPK